ncbi:MAG: hypothetical protein SGJ20_00085 [Planctomycetota bacterium]|nr:hypothetical protein [Planctomycetota bacterium]
MLGGGQHGFSGAATATTVVPPAVAIVGAAGTGGFGTGAAAHPSKCEHTSSHIIVRTNMSERSWFRVGYSHASAPIHPNGDEPVARHGCHRPTDFAGLRI